jgi:hypothetical protein
VYCSRMAMQQAVVVVVVVVAVAVEVLGAKVEQ